MTDCESQRNLSFTINRFHFLDCRGPSRNSVSPSRRDTESEEENGPVRLDFSTKNTLINASDPPVITRYFPSFSPSSARAWIAPILPVCAFELTTSLHCTSLSRISVQSIAGFERRGRTSDSRVSCVHNLNVPFASPDTKHFTSFWVNLSEETNASCPIKVLFTPLELSSCTTPSGSAYVYPAESKGRAYVCIRSCD